MSGNMWGDGLGIANQAQEGVGSVVAPSNPNTLYGPNFFYTGWTSDTNLA